MNRLKTEKRKAVVMAPMEGVWVNATKRLTGVDKEAILKLQRDLWCACAAYHNDHVRGLTPNRVECDEVWSFVYCKAKTTKYAKYRDIGNGDCWKWTAIDSDSKLIISCLMGLRTPADALAFMDDLSDRVINIGTLTTDSLASYPEAVKMAFGPDQNYAQLVKSYKNQADMPETRYSPATCVGCEKRHVVGFPYPEHISTPIVERSNLTIRMSVRRFTRLTNGHSKKIENHGHAIALFFMYYYYCRPHVSLAERQPRQLPLDWLTMTLEELIGLIP